MAAVDFPANPVLNQLFQSGDRTWVWDGTAWTLLVVQTTNHGITHTVAGSDPIPDVTVDGGAPDNAAGLVVIDGGSF